MDREELEELPILSRAFQSLIAMPESQVSILAETGLTHDVHAQFVRLIFGVAAIAELQQQDGKAGILVMAS